MEHQEPDCGQDPRRDQVFYVGHHLGRRLRGHRQRGRDQAQRDRLRARDERLGEVYDNAQTRLVVGKINLVEKIADLARRPAPGRWKDLPSKSRNQVEANFDDAAKAGDKAALNWDTGTTWNFNGAILEKKKQVIKQGLSEYFLFTIEGREDIKDKEPKRLVALKVADVPLECFYKLSDRTADQGFTKFYRFKNVKLLDEQGPNKGHEKKLSAMENLGLSPLPNGTVRLFSEYKSKDLAYVGGTETKYVPIGDRVEVNVGLDKDITIHRRLNDQKISDVVVRQYKRRLDDQFVLYYDLTDYDETFFYEEEIVSGKPVVAKTEIERQFDANVVLWGPDGKPKDWDSQEVGGLRRSAPGSRSCRAGGPATRQVFPRPSAGEEAACQLQRDLQAPQSGAGTEYRAEARAVVTGFISLRNIPRQGRTVSHAGRQKTAVRREAQALRTAVAYEAPQDVASRHFAKLNLARIAID